MKWPSGSEATREDVKGCVGKGWGKILDSLVDDLIELGWDGQVLQVKEKFGGLRFYIGGGTESIFSRIGKAESESLRTCEECGEIGTPRTSVNGWIKTLCWKCRS